MNALALLVWVSAFSSFGWGMLRFFRKPSGVVPRTAFVAVLGVIFSGWHFVLIATSKVDLLPLAVAIVLLSVSTALFWWAVAACDSQPLTAIFENDPPLRLVRRGPYRYIRHPFYASYTLFWFAGWVASASPMALLSAAAMLGIYLDAAAREEHKFAASSLATAYFEYRHRTGLMIPRLQAWYAAALLPARWTGSGRNV